MTHSSRRGTCSMCGSRMHRHGDRRLRCPNGHGTIRVYQRKRGRPRLRLLQTPTATAFLRGRESIRGIATRLDRSIGATHDRVRRRIATIASTPAPSDRIPTTGPLILVADALWVLVAGERWTVSLVLLRPVYGGDAHIVVVHPERGGESVVSWHRAIHRLSAAVRNRVVAATTDGHGGLRSAILTGCRRPTMHSIPIQRCTFHVLAELLRRLGKRATQSEAFARRAWVIARSLLREPRVHQRNVMTSNLSALRHHHRCPLRTNAAIRWFLRQVPDATVCYRATHHRMPATTGTAEAACKQLRRLLTRIRPTTESSLTLAAELYVRTSRPIRCSPHRSQ